MTHAARDERDRDRDRDPEDDLTDPTYYTRAQVGPGPEDVQWTPLVDPAAIAAIQETLVQGIDPPYEVWVDPAPAPAALGPGDPTLTPAEEAPALYAWEQTGPTVGEGHRYEVTDPVVIAAYEEAHPAPGAVEIANPAGYYEAATVPAPEQTPDLTPGADRDRDLTPALDR